MFLKRQQNRIELVTRPGFQTQQCSDGEGEGGGVSDSPHPDTVTDPELSDPPIVTTSSPPQSGDEVKNSGKEKSVGRSLFPREIRLMRGRGGGGGVTSTPDRSRTVSASVASNVATESSRHDQQVQ